MKINQEYSPKYWVGHHKQTTDVLLHTASKTRHDVCRSMEAMYGEDWFLDDDFEVILIELKQVIIKG